ncbi:pantoate--beta-alanine ligase [Desulforhopalus sp. 52FAK]
MKIIKSVNEMTLWSTRKRSEGRSIALVPTMGCLHDGHLSLIDIARKNGDLVIVSIFVNPMQFGPGEDLDAYPRQFETDCNLAEDHGADLIFAPSDEEMYDSSFQTCISVPKLASDLCGADRPGHFDGVATVVTKLFNITQTSVAVFGQKDFQQLTIIRQLVRDLNIGVNIIAGPIVRESDGLAMSSRNKYLLDDDRETALCLSKAIARAKEVVDDYKDAVETKVILDEVVEIITSSGAVLEYAKIIDINSLLPKQKVTPGSVIAVAAKIGGRVRLIDNSVLKPVK